MPGAKNVRLWERLRYVCPLIHSLLFSDNWRFSCMQLNQSEVIFAPTLLVLQFNSIYIYISQCFRNWLHAAKSLASPEEAKAFCLDAIEEDISILEKELSQGHQHIVFCHNDLQYGNIMIDEKTNSITIIVSSSLCWLSKFTISLVEPQSQSDNPCFEFSHKAYIVKSRMYNYFTCPMVWKTQEIVYS